MKPLTEYLMEVARYNRMADLTSDETLKAELQKQAAKYRKLATKKAEQLGIPVPEACRK